MKISAFLDSLKLLIFSLLLSSERARYFVLLCRILHKKRPEIPAQLRLRRAKKFMIISKINLQLLLHVVEF
jgi:hypothetical protein